MPFKHNFVDFFGIRTAGNQIMMPSQLLVIIGKLTLQRQSLFPPVHNASIFGKESMTADIHAIAVISDGARNSAELLGGFQDRHVVFVFPVFDEFPRGSQTGRTRAYDYNPLFF